MGEAVYYFLDRFNYVARYLKDGQLEIDNNLAENAIRPIAIGRKNYLFAGSHEGARRAAMLYSFLGTCKRNDIEDMVNRTRRNFQLIFSDTGATTWAFAALVTGFKPSAAVEDELLAEVTLQVTGQPTLAG